MWLSQITNRGPRRAVGTKAAVKASTLLPAESQHHHDFWIKVHLYLYRFCSLRWIWLTKFWSPNQPSWSNNNRATTSIKAPVLSWLMTRLWAGLYVGDALYSPLLFLHMWIEMQSEGKRKRGGTYAQGKKKGKKKQCFIGREIYKISGTSVNFEPCWCFFLMYYWSLQAVRKVDGRWSVRASVETESAAWVRENTVCSTAGLSSIFIL